MTKTPSTETQIGLETLFSKYQLLPVLREQFSELSKEYPYSVDRPFVEDALSHLCLHRTADPETMVGILSPKYGEPQEVADKLLLLVELDYMDFDQSLKTPKFVIKYDVSDDVKAMLDRYQYPLPMVIKPDKVTKNTETGYKTIKGLAVLNSSEYFLDKDICLDHLNRANAVALCLDEKVINSNEGIFQKPVRKIGEEFTKFHKRKKQAETFFTTSAEVMEGLISLTEKLYLTHKYDRRGRCYASGYHVNTQGNDYSKAVIQLANKELIK